MALAILLALGLALPGRIRRTDLMNHVSDCKRLLTVLQLHALEVDTLPADLGRVLIEVGCPELRPVAEDFIFLVPGAEWTDLSPGTPVIRWKGHVEGKTIVGYADGQVRLERVNSE